jgi:hypothetical protein
MPSAPAQHRRILGLAFLVGGALQIVAALVALGNAGNSSALYALSNILIGIGFALMMAWLASTTIARVAYLVAAVGWLLLALTSLLNLGILGTLALFVAIIGSIFAGVVVFSSRPFRGRADIVFFVAVVVGAANLLLSQNANVPGLLRTLVVVVFGALLITAGALMLQRRL